MATVRDVLGHIGAGLKYLATARRQHASDLLTARQLEMPPGVLPPGLSVTWIGTAGYRLAFEGTVLWIDPYVTRLSLPTLLRRGVVRSSATAVARWIDRADAILVGHTHFDHALDVPAIAARFGCEVYGSASLARLMALHGQRARAIVVEPHHAYEIGPFRVRFIPSVHARLALGVAIPYAGELTCDHVDHLTPQAYRCGQVWGISIEVAGARIYHAGSADLIDDEIHDPGVDVVLCGIQGRRFTDRFVARVVRALEPAVIVPTHYDDLFRPLGSETRLGFNVNLTAFVEEVRQVTRLVPVHMLDVGVPVGPNERR